jgi:hypothetical protein
VSRPKNDTFLRALMRQPTDYTPLWLMRQAGRYLPEYRETRKRAGSFLDLCKSPGMACEVTLQPLTRYKLDAAILFSDILTVPDAMGLGLYFAEGEGPKFERPLKEEWEIRNLAVPDPNIELGYVMDAVAEIRRALDNSVPLIGFSGSPWTLACYMVEGGGSDDYRKVKGLLYSRPDLMHHILGVTAQAVTAYLNAQIEAGAQAVMIFDSWGGVLAHDAYREFSSPTSARSSPASPARRTASASRASCSPRAAACGWPTSPTAAPTQSASTGRWTSAPPGAWSATRSRCRATSTRPCCSAAPKPSPPKPARCSTPTAPTPATSSTSATASPSSPARERHGAGRHRPQLQPPAAAQAG